MTFKRNNLWTKLKGYWRNNGGRNWMETGTRSQLIGLSIPSCCSTTHLTNRPLSRHSPANSGCSSIPLEMGSSLSRCFVCNWRLIESRRPMNNNHRKVETPSVKWKVNHISRHFQQPANHSAPGHVTFILTASNCKLLALRSNLNNLTLKNVSSFCGRPRSWSTHQITWPSRCGSGGRRPQFVGFFRRFIRKPELILAECATAPWDVVGSSELSEEFRTFRLFFFGQFCTEGGAGTRGRHNYSNEFLECDAVGGGHQLKTSLPVPGIEAFCFWWCGTRACCVRRWVCAEIGSIRILRIDSQPPFWNVRSTFSSGMLSQFLPFKVIFTLNKLISVKLT